MNFVAIDFETANHRPDSACAIGLVKVVDGVIAERIVHLIKPPTREFVFTYIHGLSWKDVAQAEDFGQLWPQIEPIFVGAEFLVAHMLHSTNVFLQHVVRRMGCLCHRSRFIARFRLLVAHGISVQQSYPMCVRRLTLN